MTSKESIDSMLRHEELPHLVALATTLTIMKEEILLNNGKRWASKQRLPASSLSVEETLETVVMLGERLKSLSYEDHTSVRRGDFPITDSLMDDAFKILRTELTDMTAFQDATAAPVLASRGNSKTASFSTAKAKKSKKISRKRSYFVLNDDDCFEESQEDVSLVPMTALPFRARSIAPPAAASHAPEENSRKLCRPPEQDQCCQSKSISKWQIDSLMDWMKQNEYNPSPSWEAIDFLVEKTCLKPSQIAKCASEIGNVVSKLLQHQSYALKTDEAGVSQLSDDGDDIYIDGNDDEDALTGYVSEVPFLQTAVPLRSLRGQSDETTEQHFSTDIDEVSIPELSDDVDDFDVDDALTGLVADFTCPEAGDRSFSRRAQSDVKVELDSLDLEAWTFDPEFDFGDLQSCDGLKARKEDESLFIEHGELIGESCVHLISQIVSDDEVSCRPTKRARFHSFDGIISDLTDSV